MYPHSDTFVRRSGYITARDQSMVEISETKGGKNTASFLFREMNTTTQTVMKPQAKKQRFSKLSQKRNSS